MLRQHLLDGLLAHQRQPGRRSRVAERGEQPGGQVGDSIYEGARRRMLDGDDPDDVHRGQPAVIGRAVDLLEHGLRR